MRPKQDISVRIARYTGVSSEVIARILEHPRDIVSEADCLPWSGQVSLKSYLPVFQYDGRPKSVRRTLVELQTKAPLPSNIQVEQACSTSLCVHPDHMRQRQTWTFLERQMAETADLSFEDVDTVDDVAIRIYSQPEPWVAEELAERLKFSLSLVRETLQLMSKGII